MSSGLDVELRKLPPGTVFGLAGILECGESWKQLMSIIPSEENPDKAKYSVEHMKMIECAGFKQKRMCSEILLEEWGTSGKVRPRLSSLCQLLVQAQLFRAAEYVAVNLLKQEAPQRPLTGPAARVEIPTSDWLSMAKPPKPTAPPLSLSLSHTVCPSFEPLSETVVSLQLKETVPIESLSEPLLNGRGLPEITYGELERGTEAFSSRFRLGGGAFGEVYLCKLSGGSFANQEVAVKRLFQVSPGGIDPRFQFRNEVEALAQLSHPNLLGLIGYSTDGPSLCLIYHYMPNGSLQDRLECKDGMVALSWEQRLSIAVGSARGVLYLHTSAERPLVHRDVKSANILLDLEMNPKVADFGLVRTGSSGESTRSLAVVTTTVVGTSAYMAPEAFRGDVSVKMDVFSFGVVLLELITGLPPFDENREGCDIASHVEEVDNIEELIDNKAEGARSIAMELYSISENCLLDKKKRPFIATVLECLLQIATP